jgi:hypothetical protein
VKRFARLVGASCLALVACSSDGGPGSSGTGGAGGTAGTSGSGGASGDAGSGGAGGAAGTGGAAGSGGTGGNPACASAVATQSCTAEGTVCGSERCTSMCQFCNLTRCMNGVWQSIEVAPVPCFSCGNAGLQCQSYTQYCEVTIGGVPGSIPSYRCPATPAACSPTPTCSCFQNQGIPGGSSCAQTVAGQVTVTLAAP